MSSGRKSRRRQTYIPGAACLRYSKTSFVFLPLTSAAGENQGQSQTRELCRKELCEERDGHFFARGNVTPWLTWQKLSISSSDPGS